MIIGFQAQSHVLPSKAPFKLAQNIPKLGNKVGNRLHTPARLVASFSSSSSAATPDDGLDNPTSISSDTVDGVDILETTTELSPKNDDSSTSSLSPTSSSPKDQPVNWRGLLSLAATQVKQNIWPLLLVHCICDVLIFFLHRCSHRLTNELAVNLLGGGALTPAAIGNMWWLSADPAISNFQTGYQILTIIVFLLAFPVNIVLKTVGTCFTIFICKDEAGKKINSNTPWWRPVMGMKRAVPAVRALLSQVSAVWKRVFVVELLVSAAVIPLQFASLAVITLPLTLPLILSLYAAAPIAALDGLHGLDAVKRSHKLIKPIRWALAIPFVGLVVSARGAEALKGQMLAAMPPRFYKELIELPAALLIGGFVLSLLLSRMQDVLPYVAFTEAKRKEDGDDEKIVLVVPDGGATP
jgi:hypothetical protein